MEINELGQPVGDPVQGWVVRERPSADVLVGRYCTLQRLDPLRHAEDCSRPTGTTDARRAGPTCRTGRSPTSRVTGGGWRAWLRVTPGVAQPSRPALLSTTTRALTANVSY